MLAQRAALLEDVRFNHAGVNDIREYVVSLFFEQYFTDELLPFLCEKIPFDKRVPFVESGKIHLQLRRGGGSVDNQLAFFLGAGDDAFPASAAAEVVTKASTKER